MLLFTLTILFAVLPAIFAHSRPTAFGSNSDLSSRRLSFQSQGRAEISEPQVNLHRFYLFFFVLFFFLFLSVVYSFIRMMKNLA